MEWTKLLANILTLNKNFDTIEKQISKIFEYQRDLEARHYGLGMKVAKIAGHLGLGLEENE
ncbi:MAG: hypothetical protein RX318_04555 [bacterium]|nr:hypothetical protein [bacterium]